MTNQINKFLYVWRALPRWLRRLAVTLLVILGLVLVSILLNRLQTMLALQPELALFLLLSLITLTAWLVRQKESELLHLLPSLRHPESIPQEEAHNGQWAFQRAIVRFGWTFACLGFAVYLLFWGTGTTEEGERIVTVYSVLMGRYFGYYYTFDGFTNFEFNDTLHEIGFWVLYVLPIIILAIAWTLSYQRLAKWRDICQSRLREIDPTPWERLMSHSDE